MKIPVCVMSRETEYHNTRRSIEHVAEFKRMAVSRKGAKNKKPKAQRSWLCSLRLRFFFTFAPLREITFRYNSGFESSCLS
jgi:hypothetical protein